jgi:hypothetical protein
MCLRISLGTFCSDILLDGDEDVCSDETGRF